MGLIVKLFAALVEALHEARLEAQHGAEVWLRSQRWYWRVRYFWMDTENGHVTHIALLCLAVLVVVMQLVRMAIAALMPPPPGEPVKAIYWWVVQLIIMIIAAIAAYALTPKAQGRSPSEQEAPAVEDGQGVLEIHGDVWIDDEFINAQQVIGKTPIKSGGKK